MQGGLPLPLLQRPAGIIHRSFRSAQGFRDFAILSDPSHQLAKHLADSLLYFGKILKISALSGLALLALLPLLSRLLAILLLLAVLTTLVPLLGLSAL